MLRYPLRALVCIPLIFLWVGCRKNDEPSGPELNNDSAVEEPGPAPAVCEPLATRRCDCEIGTGEQWCTAAGDEWSACLCPVKRLDVREGALEIRPATPGTAWSDDQVLHLPLEGNQRYLQLEPGTVVYLLEGSGFIGRVLSVTSRDDEVVISTEFARLDEAFDRLEIQVDETELNVPAYAPEDLLSQLEIEAESGVPAWGTGFTYDKGFWSVRSLGTIETFDVSFDPGSRARFVPTMSTHLDIDWFTGELHTFELTAGVDSGFVIKPRIDVKGAGQVSIETELIQLAQKLAGAPVTKPLEIPLGAGFTAEVTINVRMTVGIDGEGTYRTPIEMGIDAKGTLEYDDGDWNTGGSAEPSVKASVAAEDVTTNVWVQLEIKPRFRLRFVKAIYGYAEAGPYAKANMEVGARKRFSVVGGANGVAALGAEIDLEAKVFTLFEAQWPLFREWWTLYEREFAVCGDGYRQKNSEKKYGEAEVVSYREECDAAGQPDSRDSCNASCTCNPGFEPSTVPEPRAVTAWIHGSFDASGEAYNYCTSLCGNGVVDPGEACDDGNTEDDCGGCSRDCQREVGVCGDGIQDVACGELCDDGNDNDCDECVECFLSQVCGDNRVDAHCGETCDDGDQPDDRCSDTCQTNVGYCGDGIVNYNGSTGAMDACDDGNIDPCDGCDRNCQVAAVTGCGDGFVCGTEQCEPATPGQDGFNCDADCTLRVCGDGYANSAAEACDEVSASCDPDCTVTTCGDRTINPLAGEECDDGGVDTASCNADCTRNVCGDGVVNSVTETCDDGDTSNCTPACNSTCTGPATPAVCGDGFVTTECGDEVCDDGSLNGACGYCSIDCQTAPTNVCGDGVQSACEACDDGNTNGGDGCSADCSKVEVCGDSFIDEGEVCDDGNTNACAGPCAPDCLSLYTDVCGDATITTCEVCEDSDPTNTSVDDGCTSAQPNCNGCQGCSSDVCGDGIVGPSEVCDPPGFCAEDENIACTIYDNSNCPTSAPCFFNEFECAGSCSRVVTCGDGFRDGVEQCDDGDATEGDGCDTNCTFSGCGNGIQDPSEGCDDGNTLSGDGCSATCVVE